MTDPAARADDDWIAEAAIPLGMWWQLTDTDVEVRWIERSGIRWLQHRLISDSPKGRPDGA